MLSAIIALAVLAVIFGLALGYAAVRFKVEGDPLVEKIDALLPQTQCGQCTFPGCRPYAEAIAKGDADINQCPPGGETTIIALADLLGRDPKPLNPENGEEKPKRVAVIDEQVCIGCTLCIQACPVDAILGAAKHMHTVIAQECTGCDLCVPPCPVDCIDMVNIKPTVSTWGWDYPTPLPENLARLANQTNETSPPPKRNSSEPEATGVAETTKVASGGKQ
ncbi:MAG: electron transport complex subunit RsxB [Gammaproteobacteria bacterium]|nr:electron transport complex subunit RsxB [Gammaproteobacteria bacterium]